MRVINKLFDPRKILLDQSNQYTERLFSEDTIPAGQGKTHKVSIGSLGHFLCLWITGSFSSLTIKDAQQNQVWDLGVNYLSIKLRDGNGDRSLFDDFIPLDLWLSPGRTRTEATFLPAPWGYGTLPDDLGPVGNNLFIPIEFEYMFRANSEIVMECRNTSDFQNRYRLCFHGLRIRTQGRV